MTFKPIYKLLDWIQENQLDVLQLTRNKNAIQLIEKDLEKELQKYLDEDIEQVVWSWLSNNPNAIHILEKNIEKVNWTKLS